jgi:predicted phosphoribosyltransferase
VEGRFEDRADAGRRLAERLSEYADQPGVIVLALPRGGVPVAAEVARSIRAPLDVLLVRKLGVPGHEELAMGALASGGVRVLNEDVIRSLQIPDEVIDRVALKEQRELERREGAYRAARPHPKLWGRVVILIDDGLATGSTMRAAVSAVRAQGPSQIVVAVPVAAVSTCEEFQELADACVCLETPDPFQAVGLWYDNFSQTTDDEVRELLRQTAEPTSDSRD